MKIKVLSLFDGMSCGMIAFNKCGIEVTDYDAYEIDKYAIKTSEHNFPNIRHHGDVFKDSFTKYEGVDFLIGGSPCTYWSVAQKNGRETEASGLGWDLFSQYVRALHEAKPKYFIYENNKSMSNAIRDSIRNAFGFEEIYINSGTVSAQNRQRYYWVGKRNEDGTYSKVNVNQPKDKGILLRDIIESGTIFYETKEGKAFCIPSSYYKTAETPFSSFGNENRRQRVAEPIKIGCLPSPDGTIKNSQAFRIYSQDGKSVTQSANGGGSGGKTGLYAIPIKEIDSVDKVIENSDFVSGESTGSSSLDFIGGFLPNGRNNKWLDNGKVYSRNFKQGYRLHGINGKATTQTASGAGIAGNTGLYAIPINKCNNSKPHKIFEVKNGKIKQGDKEFDIKLEDGLYFIRRLSVKECARLQTVPENFEFPVSECRALQLLGNGWTVDVIVHLIKSALNMIDTDEQI